jgi:hypothetical protein
MAAGFVLGNGVSRRQVDLDQLKLHGTVYGCNALYREFVPDVLISTDNPISTHIQQSGYSANHTHYTRKPLPDTGAQRVPQQYFGFSSGPIAVGIAALARHESVYLIGFDMGPTRTGHFNNCYADTEFYKKSSANPTFTGNWVRQLKTIAKEHLTTRFVRVQGDTTAQIPELLGISNMSHMPIEDFLNRINNTKEF